MNKLIILGCTIVLFVSCLQIESSECKDANLDSLELVLVIFVPGQSVSENSETSEERPSSNGQTIELTEKGKEQSKELGEFLKERYKELNSESFVAEEVLVISADSNDSISTAQIALAGLGPFTLKTIPKDTDNMLGLTKECPRVLEAYHDLEEMKTLNAENADLFQYLSEHAGYNITSIEDFDAFFKSMMAKESQGKLPEWAAPIIYSKKFQRLYNISLSLKVSTPELKRLRSGPLLESINLQLFNKTTDETNNNKFILYSGNDQSLLNVLKGLDIFDMNRPSFASALMIELRKIGNETLLNFFYRNDTSREPYKLQIPACQNDCPYSDFVKFIEPFIPQDWAAECLSNSSTSAALSFTETPTPIWIYAVIGVSAILIAILLIGCCCCCCSKDAYGRRGYQRVGNK